MQRSFIVKMKVEVCSTGSAVSQEQMVIKVVKCPEAESVDETKERKRNDLIDTKRMLPRCEERSLCWSFGRIEECWYATEHAMAVSFYKVWSASKAHAVTGKGLCQYLC